MILGFPGEGSLSGISNLTQKSNSYFANGANSTTAGMVDYMFENKLRFLHVDEIDEMSQKSSLLTEFNGDGDT
jgi:hypothetical protein